MIPTIIHNPSTGTVDLIDQTRLPHEKAIIAVREATEMADCIRTMKIRGAPAIGVAAAFGVALAVERFAGDASALPPHLDLVYDTLSATRPTAVNLFWGIDRMRRVLTPLLATSDRATIKAAAWREAQAILDEDIAMCRTIGRNGATFLRDGGHYLTHCNAGALATAGYGTALGVFRAAVEAKKHIHVYVDETRPWMQGARLTTWELVEENIPATLICDNMAGFLMSQGKIEGVVVGADRITRRGFVANKIGTYAVAVLARYHKIPFYVAAPRSTFDLSKSDGHEIVIEERDAHEVTHFRDQPVAPLGMQVRNPAFDVTPPELVSAIFTDVGVVKAPYEKSIAEMLGQHCQ